MKKEILEEYTEHYKPSFVDLTDILPKQETLEEAAERLFPDSNIQKRIFIKGSKYQQERSYSKEEVLEILKKYEIDNHCQGESYFNSPHIKKWFENNPFKQFKKK